VRAQVKGMAVSLPDGCVGRFKEKWRPLKRIAVAAGGDWPDIVDRLIRKNLDEDAAERDAGLKQQPPGVVLLMDLHTAWPDGVDFVPTRELVRRVIGHNPDYWGSGSSLGKELTDTRFGRIIVQACKATSLRPGGGPRGFARSQFKLVWHKLGISRSELGAPGKGGEPGGGG
jgi:hypothetical protein